MTLSPDAPPHAQVCPLLGAAHARLAAAEFLRVDYDPAMAKPSAKEAKAAALARCEGRLRQALALEGQPAREPRVAAPPPTTPLAAEEKAGPPATPPATEAPAAVNAKPTKTDKPAAPAKGRTAAAASAAGRGRAGAPAASVAGRGAAKPAARASLAAATSPGKAPAARSPAAKPGAASSSTRGLPATSRSSPAVKRPAVSAAAAPKKADANKTEAKKASSAASPPPPAASPAALAKPAAPVDVTPMNPKLSLTRLELGKVLRELHGAELDAGLRDELVALYHEVMEMEPMCVDAYTGVQAVLAPTDPLAAIAELGKYPGHKPPNFDDSFVHTDILQLYVQVGKKDRDVLDAPQLEKSLLIAGKVMGFPGIEKYVDFLDGKGRWGMLRRVHAAINGVPESEMQDFFEAKGWPADEE